MTDDLLAFPPEGLPVKDGLYAGKTALITGCSPGTIPLGVAKVFAAAGGLTNLLLHCAPDTTPEAVDALIRPVLTTGTKLSVISADFRSAEEVLRVARWAESAALPDVVVHGAGVTAYSSIVDPIPAANGAVKQVKIDALKLLGDTFLRSMAKRRSGVWCGFGSIQADYTCGNEGATPDEFLGNFDYRMANIGVEVWCQLVARTFGPSRVAAFCHRPSLTDNLRHRSDAAMVEAMRVHAATVPSRMVPGPIDHAVSIYGNCVHRVALGINGNNVDLWAGEGQRLPQK